MGVVQVLVGQSLQPVFGHWRYRAGSRVRGASIAGLKRTALNTFRAKRYAEACDLFARVQNLTPTDVANLGDLGLCKQRAGDTADALVIDRYALELAASDSAQHARLRHAVYYNLAELDTKKPVAFAKKACTELESDTPSCNSVTR